MRGAGNHSKNHYLSIVSSVVSFIVFFLFLCLWCMGGFLSSGANSLFMLQVITGISLFFVSIVIIIAVWTKNWQRLWIFFLFFLFATSFELINMHGTRSYEYSEYSPLMIGGLPLYIPLIWSLLLFFVTQQIPAYWSVWRAGFQGGFAVLLYDLSVDVLAVNQGWWTRFLDSSQGWYGVSYGNFFGRWVVAGLVCIAYQIHRRFGYPLWLLLIGSLFAQTLILVVPYFIVSLHYDSFDYGTPHWIMIVLLIICIAATWFLQSPKSGNNPGGEVLSGKQSFFRDQSVILLFDCVVHGLTALLSFGLIPFGLPLSFAIILFAFSIIRLLRKIFLWKKSWKIS